MKRAQKCFGSGLLVLCILILACNKKSNTGTLPGAWMATELQPVFAFIKGPNWPPDSSIISIRDEFFRNTKDTVLFSYWSFCFHGMNCTSWGWAIKVNNNNIEATAFRFINPKKRTDRFSKRPTFEREPVADIHFTVVEVCTAIDSLTYNTFRGDSLYSNAVIYIQGQFGNKKPLTEYKLSRNMHLSSTEGNRGHDFYRRAWSMVGETLDKPE